jgi:preprotein translocase subunit SecE
MNIKTDAAPLDNKFDILKWLIVVLLAGGGLFSFYYFEEQYSQLIRVITLLAGLGIAIFVSSKTERGRAMLEFVRESHLEVRKVVWPTRQETVQMTGLVILMVVILAIVIWLLDSLLLWTVRLFTS